MRGVRRDNIEAQYVHLLKNTFVSASPIRLTCWVVGSSTDL
jgi:hypothetical protein